MKRQSQVLSHLALFLRGLSDFDDVSLQMVGAEADDENPMGGFLLRLLRGLRRRLPQQVTNSLQQTRWKLTMGSVSRTNL